MIRPFPLQRLALAALLAAVAACDRAGTPTGSLPAGDLGPRLVRTENAIPGRYIVVFNQTEAARTRDAARQLVTEHGGRLHHTYENTIRGFAASLSPEAVEALLNDPRVAYVAEDGIMTPTVTQTPATWGLDRIDQRALPLNNSYTYTPTGSGVRAYVIDSGILTSHTEFGGRASVGVDFVGDGQNGQDCNGHGTHVAGTIGGTTYGVAKQASLISVRVFPCSGGSPTSTIISAVDWVTANAVKPAVVNMSLGGGVYAPLNDAVTASIATGLPYAVAAGNESINSCERSPASTPGAITVASSTVNDVRSNFSNWGSCVDLFAPGSDITSAWYTGTSATNTISGTSMATPHVAGVVALYLQGNPTATPAAVTSAILGSASSGRISDLQGSPNLLLYSPLTPEVLRLSTSAISATVLRTAGGSAASATAAPAQAGKTVFTASGQGGTKSVPSRMTSSFGGGEVTPSSTLNHSLGLTNSSGSSVSWTSSSNQPWLTLSPTSGTVAAGATQSLVATMSTASLAPGDYYGTITITGGGVSTTLSVHLTVVDGTVLTSGVAVNNLASTGAPKFFLLQVPEGADSMLVTLAGPNGDADLYVRHGYLPTHTEYDCASWSSSSYEACFGAAPLAGSYYIMVDAYSAYTGLTITATVWSPAPPPPPARPLAPSNVVPVGAGAGRVTVNWADNSSDETYFRVRRSARNPDGTFGAYRIIGNRGPNNTSYSDTTVAVDSTYKYQVMSCNDAGCSYSAPSAAIDVKLPPTAPSGVAGVVDAGDVNVSWNDNSANEAYFRVRRSTRNGDGTFTAYVALKTVTANVTSYRDTSSVPGGTYRYQVQACNSGGCTNSAITTVSVPTLPAPATGVAAAATGPTSVNVSWTDASTNEAAFLVRRSLRGPTGAYGAYTTVGTMPARTTAYTDGSASPASTYRYMVQACNAAGCTNSSAVVVSTPGS